jgi:hypothetical protein
MKTRFFISIVVSLTLLVSAAVWEGVTDVASGQDLPGNYSIATNAFPRNSVVDITNLENGKIVRAIVVSGLETRGLLATLSRNAANSIDLRGNSTGRIRITQPSDEIAFSHFKLGPIAAVTPPSEPDDSSSDTARQSIAQESAEAVSGTATAAIATGTAEPLPADKNTGTIAARTAPESAKETAAKAVTEPSSATPLAASPVKPAEETAGAVAGTKAAQAPAKTTPKDAAVQAPAQTPVPADAVTAADSKPAAAAQAQKNAPPTVDNPPEAGNIPGNLIIVPSEERPPNTESRYVIAPEDLVPPLKKDNSLSNVPPSNPSPSNASSPGMSDFSPFQVPLISRMEQGKCYVQVAAYQRVEHVEDEINRIGTAYPLAVQNVGSDTKPMFRILLGPLNQGESGAMLQRFKSIGYNDAFIRYN